MIGKGYWGQLGRWLAVALVVGFVNYLLLREGYAMVAIVGSIGVGMLLSVVSARHRRVGGNTNNRRAIPIATEPEASSPRALLVSKMY